MEILRILAVLFATLSISPLMDARGKFYVYNRTYTSIQGKILIGESQQGQQLLRFIAPTKDSIAQIFPNIGSVPTRKKIIKIILEAPRTPDRTIEGDVLNELNNSDASVGFNIDLYDNEYKISAHGKDKDAKMYQYTKK